MIYTLKKLVKDVIVTTRNGYCFRKLTTEEVTVGGIQIDITSLGLPEGTYKISVVSSAQGFNDSEHSNTIIYRKEN